MKKHFLVLICLFLLGIHSGSAQPKLGMGAIGPIGYNDTVNAGAVDSFYVWVKNIDASISFNDTLNIAGAVRDTLNPTVLHPLGMYNVGVKSISVNDSIIQEIVAFYDITTNNYQAGINVIVIWPVAQSATTSVDSLEFNVFIIKANGMNELDLKQFIKTYPNPSLDHFRIENNSQSGIEEVRIYDMSGCLIGVVRDQSVINTKEWSPGMYLVDIRMKNNQRHSVRVMKQK